MSLIDKVEAVKFISDKQKQTEMSEEFRNGVSWAIARLAEVPETIQRTLPDDEEVAQAFFRAGDCIRYFSRMTKLNDCNNCGKAHPPRCEYMPDCGDNVRVNCPLWESEGQK